MLQDMEDYIERYRPNHEHDIMLDVIKRHGGVCYVDLEERFVFLWKCYECGLSIRQDHYDDVVLEHKEK